MVVPYGGNKAGKWDVNTSGSFWVAGKRRGLETLE